MNKVDVCALLETFGWYIKTDEVGDKAAFFDLQDRIVDIIPDLRSVRGEQQLSVSPTLSTPEFISACQKILAKNSEYTPLVRAWKSNRIRSEKLDEEHIRQASEQAIAWAKAQDLDIALKEYAALPTTASGARPVWHLGALAVLGNVEKLMAYRTSFLAGERMGFVNYITSEHIERALAAAKDSVA